MRAVQSICMITLFVLRPAGGGHPGCAGRSHPATDLPRNANHAAGITGEQQQPRPRGRHRSARPGRLRNDPALLLRRDCKNTQEPSGVTESRPSSHRSGHDRRGVSPSPPGVVARTGPLRSSGPVSGPMASHTRCWGTTPDHRPPRERQRRCRRYEPAVGPAQPGRSTSRNAQERRATETVLAPPGDGTTLWPSFRRSCRLPVRLPHDLANMVQLGRSATFRSTVQAHQSPSRDWRKLH